jgi:hypothetical protein
MRKAKMNHPLIATDIEMSLVGVPDERYIEFMHRRIPSKDRPGKMRLGDTKLQFHNDGLFLEFATPPMTDPKEVVELCHEARDHFNRVMPYKFDFDYGMEVPEFLRDSGHPILELGCAPDSIVTEMGTNFETRRVPHEVRASMFREAGMHVHVDVPAWARLERRGIASVVHELQLVLGEAQARTLNMPEHGWYRRPGVFRQKDYGVEYRSLSAAMMRHMETAEHCFSAAIEVIGGYQ